MSVAVLGEPPLRVAGPKPRKLPESKKRTVPEAEVEETVAVSVTVCPTGAEDAGDAVRVVVEPGKVVMV